MVVVLSDSQHTLITCTQVWDDQHLDKKGEGLLGPLPSLRNYMQLTVDGEGRDIFFSGIEIVKGMCSCKKKKLMKSIDWVIIIIQNKSNKEKQTNQTWK